MPKLDNKQIDGLQRLLSLLDPDSLTKEQYKGDIKKILDFLLKLKEKNRAEFENLNKRFSTQSEELTGNNTISISKLKDDFTELINKALKEQENGLNFIRDKVRKLTDGKDGRDADEKKMVKRVLAQIILPEQKEMILDTPEEMANKLEELKGEDRLRIKAIKGLEEKLAELENRPLGGKGGGMTDFGVKMSMNRMVKTEVPSGLINSTNKVYTVTGKISAILSFGINGQIIHSDEYSFTNRTITFITALPTELSATRFEIIYI